MHWLHKGRQLPCGCAAAWGVRVRLCAVLNNAGLRLHLVEMVAELSELVHELQHGERAVTWRAELLET